MDHLWNLIMHEKHDQLDFLLLDSECRVIFATPPVTSYYSLEQKSVFPLHTKLGALLHQSILHKSAVFCQPVLETEMPGQDKTAYLCFLYPYSNTKDLCYYIILHKMNNIQSINPLIEYEKRKTIGEMAAGTADAILNPLAAIKGTIQLMERGSGLPYDMDKFRYYFSLLFDQIGKIETIIERFIQLGKQKPMHLHLTSLSKVIGEWLPHIYSKALSRQMNLNINLPNQDTKLYINEQLLTAVLDEIFNNAHDAVDDNGSVHLSIQLQEQRQVCIEISDNGHGIPEHLMPLVKNPFFTTKDEALGFGLSYCDQIIHHMGGNLEIVSSRSGTSVQIHLPVYT
ncbi:sensor histidine kinase [Marinicrinis lubricantis]|uniref:histidine kinase n=1 Tax=Marinicrinis lubricantis TaxID=2086470 RepID=A0ABW1IP46_9BACL